MSSSSCDLNASGATPALASLTPIWMTTRQLSHRILNPDVRVPVDHVFQGGDMVLLAQVDATGMIGGPRKTNFQESMVATGARPAPGSLSRTASSVSAPSSRNTGVALSAELKGLKTPPHFWSFSGFSRQ